MEPETNKTSQLNETNKSVCKTADEDYRLQRLLEIFIEVDKKLSKQRNERQAHIRNSDNSSQT